MKNIFNIDSPLMQMLTRLGEMIIINFLCLVCCLPVITTGAALSATHRIMQDYVTDNEGSLIKTFFRAFKENFKQATITWLVLLVLAVAMVLNFIFVGVFLGDVMNGIPALALYAMLGVMSILAVGIAVFLFPLLTRYKNTLRQHVINSLILTITKPHLALAMVLLHAFPLLLLYFFPSVFLQTLIFWLLVGVAFLIYVDNAILRKVYVTLENQQ